MDFQPDETQSHIRELARIFARECVAPEAGAWDRDDRIPDDFLLRMARQGFLGMTAPPQFGGSAVDPVGFVLALSEVSAASPALGLVMSVHNQVCDAVGRFGTEDQRRRFLPDLAAGGRIGSIALSEPRAGSGEAAVEASAERVDGGYVLNGRKMHVPNGAYPGVALVCARVSPGGPGGGGRRAGLTFFLVDKGAEGTRREAAQRTLGLRAAGVAVHRFADCFIREEDRLGEEGSGLRVIEEAAGMGRLGIAAQCVGIARAAFDLALRHAQAPDPLGGPLANLQAVQFSLADMATAIDAAELLTLRAAWRKARGEPCGTEAAMAKLLASEAAGEVTDAALQLHGGGGYLESSPVARLYADARGTRICEGTSEVLRLLIARELIGALKGEG